MIVGTGTMSQSDAFSALHENVWHASKNLPSVPHGGVFWIGFDEGDLYRSRQSPLRRLDFHGLIVTMADEDEDGIDKHRERSPLAPTQEIADAIVSRLLDLEQAQGRYIVPLHCVQGAYRSGAVVEWMVRDLGVQEDKTSRRVIQSPRQPTFNKAFLRMLTTASDRLAPPSMRAKILRNRQLSLR